MAPISDGPYSGGPLFWMERYQKIYIETIFLPQLYYFYYIPMLISWLIETYLVFVKNDKK